MKTNMLILEFVTLTHDIEPRYEIAKESKEAELKKDEDEKAEKEGTLEEGNAKIEHFTAVISQAQQDIT